MDYDEIVQEVEKRLRAEAVRASGEFSGDVRKYRTLAYYEAARVAVGVVRELELKARRAK